VRSEKKRKMENVAEFGFHDYTLDPISVDHIYQEECEEETKENSKGNTILQTSYADFLRSPCSQPSVLPEYQGVDLKDVQTESSLFEGLTFSKLLARSGSHPLKRLPVVASDPKSRTRDADKEQLLKL
jgi:hypothetical protein